MKTTTIEQVRGRDLPPLWAEEAGVGADELVDVLIRPPREQRLKRLFDLMDRMGEEARQRGLTEEKLQVLLEDD